MNNTTKKITIVEGNDDVYFINGLCAFLKINNLVVKSINPKGRGGKSNLFIKEEINQTLKESGLEGIKQVAVICDADFTEVENQDGFLETKTKLDNLITKLSGIQDFSYFILPNNQNDGNLESLFLQCLSENLKSKEDCVDNYLNCIQDKSFAIVSHRKPKVKSHILLSSLGYKENLRSIGYAINKESAKNPEDYFDFESPALDPLKHFLINFTNS
jgi:hypothetical protein